MDRIDPPIIFHQFGADILVWGNLTRDQRRMWWSLQDSVAPPEGCICRELPADLEALAESRYAHARRCPLYKGALT